MPLYSYENPHFTPILDQVFKTVPCVQSSIYLLDSGYLKYLASRGILSPEMVTKLNFPLERTGGAKVALDTNRPVLVKDVKDESNLAHQFQESAQVAPDRTFDFIGSWIGIPLQVGGETIGLLDVCHEERGFFTEEHVEKLAAEIDRLALSIEKAILVTSLAQRSTELETILAVQRAIYSHLDMNVVMQLIADQAQRLTRARQILIFLRDSDHLYAVASAGATDSNLQPGFILPIHSTLVAEAIRTNQPKRVLNPFTDDRIDWEEYLHLGVRSMLAIPLKTTTTPVGVLMAVDNFNSAFGPDDERVLTMLAAGAAIGIDNATLYREERERRFGAEMMGQILALLSANQPLDSLLSGVLSISRNLFQADAGVVHLINQTSRVPERIATLDLDVRSIEMLEHLIVCPQTARDRTPSVFIDHLSQTVRDKDFSDAPEIKADAVAFSTEFESVLHIPFVTRNDVLGFLDLLWHQNYQIEEERKLMAGTIGMHVALAIERERLGVKAEELARLQERQRIAQTLHDTVTQILFRAGIETKWVAQSDGLNEETIKRVRTIQHLISRSSYELRSAIFALSNPQLSREHSLIDLLQAQVGGFQNESGINTSLIAPKDLGEIPIQVTEAIYRLVREALSNIYKHANATAAFVSIERKDDRLYLIIQDDGQGLAADAPIDTAEAALHFGVNSMRQLIHPLGGAFTIENNEDHGVTVKAIIPVQAEKNK